MSAPILVYPLHSAPADLQAHAPAGCKWVSVWPASHGYLDSRTLTPNVLGELPTSDGRVVYSGAIHVQQAGVTSMDVTSVSGG